jgi:hypothetical protein
VRFQVTDIFLPNPGGVLVAPTEGAELEGTIVGFSDSGHKSRVFAVVEVVRTQSLVVPMEKLQVIDPIVEGEP